MDGLKASKPFGKPLSHLSATPSLKCHSCCIVKSHTTEALGEMELQHWSPASQLPFHLLKSSRDRPSEDVKYACKLLKHYYPCYLREFMSLIHPTPFLREDNRQDHKKGLWTKPELFWLKTLVVLLNPDKHSFTT